uniref:NPC1 like intracellular cholesterol transporter 1 n=1 Tax=Oncorhynchus kisutch TaxID=8019 RepID=A0A8C7GQ60_ONCKI
VLEARHEPGYCAFYEECGRNPTVVGSLLPPIIPCLNYSRARALEGDTTACCSIKQLKSLEMSLMLSKAVLMRCPSCADNFAHLHCINTCSPDQTTTINVTRTMNITTLGIVKEAVVGYQAYLSTSFADKSFESCKNVRIPATGGYAIATMCGRYGSALCTAQRWYDFQGDSSNGLAPLDIDFRLIPEGVTEGIPDGVVPYAGRALGCNEMTPTGAEVCSCQDCQASCPVVPSPPPPAEPFTIGGVDGYLVLCVIFLCVLILAFLLFVLSTYLLRKEEGKDSEKGKGKRKGMDKNGNNVSERLIEPWEVTCTDKNSLATQEFLGSGFRAWGTLVASHPLKVLLASAVVTAAFATGLMHIELTTDPVQLWSAPNSRARMEKDFHDKHFDPFFRTNQMILTAPGRPGHFYDSLLFGKQNFSGIIAKDLILELLKLQRKIQNIEFWSNDLNRMASLKDVCFAPLNPSNPSLTDCAVNSLPQYFQNSVANLNAKVNMTELGVTKEVDWRDHFIYCVNSPLSFKDITDLQLSCMADYGAPVFPFLAVGGYEKEGYTTAEALILTFSLNNYPRDNIKFKVALEWEQRFLDIVQEYQKSPGNPFTFAYMAERSLEDEINRTTAEDIPIFMISYAVIFVYIAVALGEYTSFSRILVDSKFLVGLGGILVVGCSVLASMGFYAWIGIPSSLIILQVVPFLVLAVGADNIFIFVLEYQRDARRPGEKREERIGRVLGNVAPSMLLCSLSESVCFFLGALSTMPAVKSFALYAALAVLMDFVLQMTAFVALLSLDARRQDGNRCELACCVTVKTTAPTKPNEGFLLPAMRKYYAPVLLHPVTRVIVIVVFIFMFISSIYLMFYVTVGLDQELAMPQGSYMLEYFKYLYAYFEVGVPTYFVTTKGFNFTSIAGMNATCSSVGCDPFSLTQKIQSYMAIPANSWVDDFIDWLNPGSKCCRLYSIGPNKGKFCPASECETLSSLFVMHEYNIKKHVSNLMYNVLCAVDKHQLIRLSSSSPSRVTYVFYEQYLTIVSEGLFNISLCLLPTFVVCCLLLGMDLRSGALNLLTIIMITVDTVGVMTLWGIDYNAVALINLVTAVGISVEFVSHMTRSFAMSIQPTHVERAKEATATMGSAVFAGVAMTNLPGIVVLAFAKAQLIQIFFFRLNLVITLLGMAHGLIFLPVLLSYFGESVCVRACKRQYPPPLPTQRQSLRNSWIKW